MLTATIDDLISWRPCPYWTDDRIRKAAGRRKKWTALHVLGMEEVPPADRLWVVLRPELIPEPTLHELACRFAEHVLPAFEQAYPNDDRPRAAIAAKRAWLRGEIDNTQLAAAWDAAGAAARAAAGDAAGDAWDAARASWAAARDAARDVAWAAWAAARDAARAAWAAARDAARAAWGATWDAPGAAARYAAGAAWDAARAAWDAEKKWQLDEVARLLKGSKC